MHGIFFHTCHRPKNTCKGIIDNTCDIGDFRAHILCPQTTQELYLRSTMKQDRLNNCLLMHCHKSITDTLATMKIAKRFACANEQRKGHLKKKIWVGVWVWLSERWLPLLPPPAPDSDIQLLNNWGQLCTWRHGGNFGGQEQKHFSSLGTELYFQGNYSEKLTTNMNIYLYSGRLRVSSPHFSYLSAVTFGKNYIYPFC